MLRKLLTRYNELAKCDTKYVNSRTRRAQSPVAPYTARSKLGRGMCLSVYRIWKDHKDSSSPPRAALARHYGTNSVHRFLQKTQLSIFVPTIVNSRIRTNSELPSTSVGVELPNMNADGGPNTTDPRTPIFAYQRTGIRIFA